MIAHCLAQADLSLSLRSSHGHPHVSCARWVISSTSPFISSPFSSSLLSSCSSCCFTPSTSLMSWITSPRTSIEELGPLSEKNSSTFFLRWVCALSFLGRVFVPSFSGWVFVPSLFGWVFVPSFFFERDRRGGCVCLFFGRRAGVPLLLRVPRWIPRSSKASCAQNQPLSSATFAQIKCASLFFGGCVCLFFLCVCLSFSVCPFLGGVCVPLGCVCASFFLLVCVCLFCVCEEIPPLFERSHQFFSQREGPLARQVHERERCESLGPRWLHDPQFDDHSELQDRECTN